MQLTKTERWTLANQYLILEKLYPERESKFREAREALERGYELQFGFISDHVYDETFTAEQCTETIDVLDMFDTLKYSYEHLKDTSGIDEKALEFPGFGGNFEGGYLSYATYFCALDGGKFTRVAIKDSHLPLLDSYRRMINEWTRRGRKSPMTKEDIRAITAASVHPEPDTRAG